jgi:CBS domain containing-hemolysin-like protein
MSDAAAGRDRDGMVFGLIAAVLLVLANGMFVAAEFALARIRPTQVQEPALPAPRSRPRSRSW